MFKQNKKELDVVDKILNACYEHNKDALFVMSLMHQYEARKWLTKKQLQGLYLKAKKIESIPNGWLATLEAIINKMPNRDKTIIETKITLTQNNDALFQKINLILQKYPHHKTILALKEKIEKEKTASQIDIKTIEQIFKAVDR